MEAVNGNVSSVLEISAMKKAMQVQETSVLKALESIPSSDTSSSPSLGLSQDGIGSQLDIRG